MTPPDPDRTLDHAPAGPVRGAADFPPPDAAYTPPSDLADLARASMEAEWARGNFVPAEWYFAHAPALAADPAALDVVFLEYVLRQENGESPTADEFATRFPLLAASLHRLIALDGAISSVPHGDTAVAELVAELDEHAAGEPAQVYIGRYLVLRPIAGGGQGDVFVGLHPGLGREVVIKVWRAGVGGTGAERLAAEGRVLASLDHPNLARVYDVDTADGRPFVVMESLRGRNLHDVRKHAPVTPAQAAAWVAAVARAADYAHARGVLHLDIKPRNVVLDETGRAVLIDFGLARVESGLDVDAAAGGVSGTLAYMAPEQARGENDRLGPPADVYGLGGVLYYLLVGANPVNADTPSGLFAKARAGDWDRAALHASGAPPALVRVCERALDPDPAKRYTSAGAFADAVTAAVRRRNWGEWLVVAGITAALAVAGWLAWPGPTPPPVPLPDPAPPAPVAKAPALHFAAEVYRGGKFHDVTATDPPRLGENVRFKGTVPANHHATLFLVTEAGKVAELTRVPAAPEERPFAHPEAVGGKAGVLRLTPPAGTHVVILATSSAGQVSADQLGLKAGDAWPRMPSDSVIGLADGKAVVVVKGRDVVPGGTVEDPEGVVADRLSRMPKAAPAGVGVEGVAFVVKER